MRIVFLLIGVFSFSASAKTDDCIVAIAGRPDLSTKVTVATRDALQSYELSKANGDTLVLHSVDLFNLRLCAIEGRIERCPTIKLSRDIPESPVPDLARGLASSAVGGLVRREVEKCLIRRFFSHALGRVLLPPPISLALVALDAYGLLQTVQTAAEAACFVEEQIAPNYVAQAKEVEAFYRRHQNPEPGQTRILVATTLPLDAFARELERTTSFSRRR